MGQSAEELRREIERTRTELSGDLEAIGDRVSPKRMIERRTNRVRDFFGTSRERVFGRAEDVRSATSDRAQSAADAVRDVPDRTAERVQGNPLAAGAVAFGVGFLAAVVFPGSQTEARAVEAVADKAQPLTEGVAQGATDAARQVASTAQEAGRDAAEQLKESATERAQQVKDTAAEEKDAAQSRM